jgi:hypothetical protein
MLAAGGRILPCRTAAMERGPATWSLDRSPVAGLWCAAMAPPLPRSELIARLDALLSSRALTAGAGAAIAAVAGLSFAGLLAEGTAAALLALLVSGSLALQMVRPALPGAVDPVTRGVALLIAVATALLAALPALTAVAPGRPVAGGEVSRAGDRIELPPGALGASSRLRLLVHAPLPAGGTPQVTFRFTGGGAPFSGEVERTVSYSRVGRGNRAAVAHDHNEIWVHGALGAGANGLMLDRIDGPVAGPLQVEVHAEWFSPLALLLSSLLVLVAAAIWEARLGGGHFAALSGMALAYGLLVAGNATPHAALGTSLGAILLGALAGALAGGLMAMLARLGPWGRPVVLEPSRRKGAKPKA